MPQFKGKIALSIAWLVFTMTFAGWWFVLERKNLDRLIVLDSVNRPQYLRQFRMIFYEGIAWELLLFAGGATLIFFVFRERKQSDRIREFFASFNHELKTSIASLRLQAEALQEDLAGRETPLLARIISDTVRLQLQLENSLFFSGQDSVTFLMEKIDVAKLIESMRHQWPNLEIKVFGSGHSLIADERALRSIIGNIIQNALIHGKAKVLTFEIQAGSLRFRDDGVGFKGDWQMLGDMFHRHTTTSGSGLGLYLVRVLTERMGGEFSLLPGQDGFGGMIQLKEAK